MKNVIVASLVAACLILVGGCKPADEAGAKAADGAAINPNPPPASKPAAKANVSATTGQADLGPGATGADSRVGSAGKH